MEQESTEHLLIRAYLLGQLPEEDQDSVELRLLSDARFIEEVAIEENRLYDDYVRGDMLEADRKAFERLTRADPGRAEKLQFAKALHRYVGQAAEPDSFSSFTHGQKVVSLQQRLSATFHNNVRGFSLAALFILITAGVIWLFIYQQGGSREAQLKRQREELGREVGRLNEGATAPDRRSVLQVGPIQPSLLRGAAGGNDAVILQDTTVVQLRLELPPPPYQEYRARLQVVGGDELFTVDGLKITTTNDSRELLLNIPARVTPPADYQLELSGRADSGTYEEVGVYSFRVIRP
jgi:hypothetical protein